MDRDGFNLIDQEYQKDLEKAKREINEELDQFYFSKVYAASKQLNKQHREKAELERRKKFDQKLQEREKIIDQFHFPEGGRKSILNKLMQSEKLKKQADRIKNQIRKNSKNNDVDRYLT